MSRNRVTKCAAALVRMSTAHNDDDDADDDYGIQMCVVEHVLVTVVAAYALLYSRCMQIYEQTQFACTLHASNRIQAVM